MEVRRLQETLAAQVIEFISVSLLVQLLQSTVAKCGALHHFGRPVASYSSFRTNLVWGALLMPIVTSMEVVAVQPRRKAGQPRRLSDATLLERACGKDAGAFEQLVARTQEKLFRVAMRYVRNESDAQEIVQNAYLSAWRSLSTFESRAKFGSWMHRITVNAALMFLRSRNRHPESASNDVETVESNDVIGPAAEKQTAREDLSPRPDEELQSAELRRHIAFAINSLPQNLKAIFLLRDVWEESTEDSAAKLKVSIPAAKTRLHRARRVLRESLGSLL